MTMFNLFFINICMYNYQKSVKKLYKYVETRIATLLFYINVQYLFYNQEISML